MAQRKAEVGDRVRIKVGSQAGKVGEVTRLIRQSHRGSVWYKGELVARIITRMIYQVRIPDGAMRGYYHLPSGHFDVIKRAQ